MMKKQANMHHAGPVALEASEGERVTARNRRVPRVWAGCSVLFLLAGSIVAALLHSHSAGRSFPLPPRRVRSMHHSPSAERLWQARWYRTWAMAAVNQERYRVLEGMAPEEARQIDTEGWRRHLMAADRSGDLARARKAAREAVFLARGPGEEYEACEWLALIDCDAGQHQDELRQARRLVELAPRNTVSLISLRRAAACNRLWPIVREVDAKLAGRAPGPPAAAPLAVNAHARGPAGRQEWHRFRQKRYR